MRYLIIGTRPNGDKVVIEDHPFPKGLTSKAKDDAERNARTYRRYLEGYKDIVVEQYVGWHRRQGEGCDE